MARQTTLSLDETTEVPCCQYYLPNEFNNKVAYENNHFSILHVNARSLHKNFDTFQELLYAVDYKFSIICVTETWLNDKLPNLFDIDGYVFVHVDRNNTKGGGVAIYIKETYQYTVRKDLYFGNYNAESLFIELDNFNSKNSCLSTTSSEY